MSELFVRPGFLPVSQYLAQPREHEAYLLKPLLPVSGACLISAPAKAGKSFMGIQIALALTGQLPDFLGFGVGKTGNVCYLQLDTPRVVWAERFNELVQNSPRKYSWDHIMVADRESVDLYPFDILQPRHMAYLQAIVKQHDPVAVIIDTLREANSGDENDSTVSRNVISNFVDAVSPAALIIISHNRKPSKDVAQDIMTDHRGSNYVVGRMDAILNLTAKKLYYAGRTIEKGDIRIERLDNGFWQAVETNEDRAALQRVLTDPSLITLRARARMLSGLLGIGEDAALSRIRRHGSRLLTGASGSVDINMGEVIA